MRVKQALLTSDELFAAWKEAAKARRLSLSAWIRSTMAEYIEEPRELPLEELSPHQAVCMVCIDFWWDQDDRRRCHEFASENGYPSLSELLRRVLAAAASKVLSRQHVEA